jgi:hypothetical protein
MHVRVRELRARFGEACARRAQIAARDPQGRPPGAPGAGVRRAPRQATLRDTMVLAELALAGSLARAAVRREIRRGCAVHLPFLPS